MEEYDIKRLLDIQGFSVSHMKFQEDNKIPDVKIYLKRDEKRYQCSGCGEYYSNYYDRHEYWVQDLPYGKWKKSWLIFDQVRVNCPHCGVVVEKLGWKEKYARYTNRLAEEVAMECRLIQSIGQVAGRFFLNWETVKEIDKAYLKNVC